MSAKPSQQPPDGVTVVPLKLLPSERGRLMEVLRADDAFVAGIAQIYVTQSYNGVVKAWYRHHHQIDHIAVISGLVKLVLYDTRETSPTKGLLSEVIFGELAPKLVVVPPGIWHGYKAIGKDDAFILHVNSAAHDPSHVDEDRLRPDDPSIPYRW